MSADNPSFKSYCGDYFWSPASPEEKEKITSKVERDCKKCRLATVVIIISLTMCVAFFTLSFVDLSSLTLPVILFLVLLILAIAYPFIDQAIVAERYIKKVRAGKFYCRRVRIEDKKMTAGLLPVYRLSIKSLGDRSDIAEADVDRSLYNEVSRGLSGMFVMIEDEPRKLLISPFWFVSDTEENVIDTKVPENVSGEVVSDELHAKIRQRYYRFCTPYLTRTMVAVMLFVITFFFMAASLSVEAMRPLLIMGLTVFIVAIDIAAISYIHMALEGKLQYSVAFIFWMIADYIGITLIPNIIDKDIVVIFAFILAITLLNIGATFFGNRKYSSVTGKIKKKDYRVLPAEVVSKEMLLKSFIIKKYYCTVRTEDNKIYNLPVEKGIFNTLKTGSKGYIIFTDGKDSDRFFI